MASTEKKIRTVLTLKYISKIITIINGNNFFWVLSFWLGRKVTKIAVMQGYKQQFARTNLKLSNFCMCNSFYTHSHCKIKLLDTLSFIDGDIVFKIQNRI